MGIEQSRYYINTLPQFYQQVNIGDILEFPRGAYSHFGIYVGHYRGQGHCVVHFTAPSAEVEATLVRDIITSIGVSQFASRAATSTLNPVDLALGASNASRALTDMSTTNGKPNTARIKVDDIRDLLLEYDHVIINNGKDKDWRPFNGSEVASRAIRHYENGNDYNEYNVYTNNCEHFVNDVRYGKPRSPQVKNMLMVGAGVGVAVVGAIGLILYHSISTSDASDHSDHDSDKDE